MANHVAAMKKIVKGVRVETTALYGEYLSFRRILDIINEALNSVEADSEGGIVYRYTSRVKTTSPYRELHIAQLRYVPNRWYEVKDIGKGSFTGLKVFEYENYNLYPDDERFITEPNTGMMYQSLPPKGWE